MTPDTPTALLSDAPAWTLSDDTPEPTLRRQGFVVLQPAALFSVAGVAADELQPWPAYWNDLPPDRYLLDGGRYRYRRHGCFVHDVSHGQLEQTPHRAHWQPTAYNALHGGIERWFEPIEPALVAAPAWHRLLTGLGALFARVSPVDRWYIEAHQFRIDTAQGVGRPTPEGAHRDGVDFVAVILVARRGVRGGETRVFEADGPRGLRFVMEQPWTAVLLDDVRVIHETTPIQPDGPDGHRDTLVLTYRRGGFQAPAA
jgi:hypothetical protein